MMKKKILTGVLSASVLITTVCAGTVPVTAAAKPAVIRIEVDEDTFENPTSMKLYLYDCTDESEIIKWDSKKGTMTQEDSSGIWSYDLSEKGITLNAEHTYTVVFSDEKGWQTDTLTIEDYNPDKDYTAVFSEYFLARDFTRLPSFQYHWKGEYEKNTGMDVIQLQIRQSSLSNGPYLSYCECFDKTDESYTLYYGRMTKDEKAKVWRFDFGSHGLTLIPGHAYDFTFLSGGGVTTTLTMESYSRSKSYTAAFTGEVIFNEYDMPYEELYWIETDNEVFYGDVNLDGRISVNDVTAFQRHLAEFEPFNDKQLAAADTNGDGKVSIEDATQLQKYLAEYPDIVLGKQ